MIIFKQKLICSCAYRGGMKMAADMKEILKPDNKVAVILTKILLL